MLVSGLFDSVGVPSARRRDFEQFAMDKFDELFGTNQRANKDLARQLKKYKNPCPGL